MDTTANMFAHVSRDERAHLENIAANLQLAADLGYGDVALLVPGANAALGVAADARPMTASSAVPTTRVGQWVSRDDEPEAYDTFETGAPACSVRRRTRRGISFMATAYPVGTGARPYGVIVRHLGNSVAEAPGKMEIAFMRLAQMLLERLQSSPLLEMDTDEPYMTTRLAGDGVIEIGRSGEIAYASPNAVNIMRLAGAEGGLVGIPASALPGGALAVAPTLAGDSARETTLEVQGRSLRYRTISLHDGALVLVEDVTEAVRRSQELHVKEMAIREVHHRVKNNLQTVAALLRIQARRSASAEAARALEEAVERVSSMAVVHEMLASSTDESVDLGAAISTVVDMVRRGLIGAETAITITVSGATGAVPAQIATSLALVAAELVHNAIEHGVGPSGEGAVTVTLERTPGVVSLRVCDSAGRLPEGFTLDASSNLGLAIVKTVVEEDLRGSLAFEAGEETRVTVVVPTSDAR